MAYLVIENFVGGLDTRRNILTSKPGNLVKLDNCHITRGGEIERRKAFQFVGALPDGTYGLESCGNSVFVFGSIPNPSPMPSGITYQRLIHPDGDAFSMTKVVSFTSYAGKPFVIAEFNDGGRYCYYDGVIVDDSVNGIFRASHTDIQGFLSHIATLLPSGFTSSVSSTGMTVIGPAGMDFTISAGTNGNLSASAMTTSQSAVKPIPEVQAKGSFIITNGTEVTAQLYLYCRQTRYENLPNLTGVFIDGVEILGISGTSGIDYNAAPGGSYPDETSQFLYTLAYYINLNTPQSGFKATTEFTWADWAGRKPASLWIKAASSDDPDLRNGDEVWFEFASRPTYPGIVRADRNDGESSFAWGTEVPSTFYRPGEDTSVPNGRWMIHAKGSNTLGGGAFNGINSVKVNGVEVMGSRTAWRGSNSATAVAVADKINSYTSSLDFTASTVDGGKVVLTALSGTGTSLNGYVIEVVPSGTCTISSVAQISGGVVAIGGVSQRTSFSLSGTGSLIGSTLTLTIIDADNVTYPWYVGATDMGGLKLNYCFTYKSKVNILAGSYLIGSALDNPSDWKKSGLGVFFIDMSNNINGSDELMAACSYQGRLAVFTRLSCQIWNIDPDPQNNSISQIIMNSGTLAPNSVIGYGEIDVFYLSDSGIRSLRARDASSQAMVHDVGVNIDTQVVDMLHDIPDDVAFNAFSVIEPNDNRLMMSIYDKTFVLSQYPSASINAWSTYTPEMVSMKMTVFNGSVYSRQGDAIYIYGGTDNVTYDDCVSEVILPYLDGTKPATMKHLMGVDLTSDGNWDFYIGTDPYAPDVRDHVATINNSTFQLGRVPAVGLGTHIGVRLVSIGSGYGRIGNLILHYELNESE